MEEEQKLSADQTASHMLMLLRCPSTANQTYKRDVTGENNLFLGYED